MWEERVRFGKWRGHPWAEVLVSDPEWIVDTLDKYSDKIPEHFHEELYERALEASVTMRASAAMRLLVLGERRPLSARDRNRGMQVVGCSDLLRWASGQHDPEKRPKPNHERAKQRRTNKHRSHEERILAKLFRD